MIRKLLIRIICTTLAFAIGTGISALLSRHPRALPPPALSSERVRSIEIGPVQIDGVTSFHHLLTEEQTISHNGYLVERRLKDVQSDDWLYRDQGYVVISKNGTDIRLFDASFYHPSGNSAEFGLFSFLGSDEKQVAISQVVGRGGTQWIVNLSGAPLVIFDGEVWDVGREDSDCEVKDLDGDGTFEITLPITDFYSLMDKMGVAGVPLPPITFKYDPTAKRFLPVNHILKTTTASEPPDVEHETNELYIRSSFLSHTLELIYEGKRKQAWQYFNTTYNLNDKKEFERRVKAILKGQPVYKFIYKNR